ncbi:right-handed parallel beta-helix repeat-containing protein [bacterium]|nr:right-handed parallel beta-helix repeat-containing protein [bacterium]
MGNLLRTGCLALSYGLLSASASWAATVYVDCKSASTGDGSQARPFSSLQAGINAVITVGGRLEVASGTCAGTFQISGLKAPLVINGAGASSTSLSGSARVTGWSVHSGTIYKKVVSNPVGQVFYQNNFLKKARYPASGFLTIGENAPATTAAASNLTLQAAAGDLTFLGGKDLVGATLTARIVDYWYNSVVVSSFNRTSGIFAMNSAPRQPTECYPNCYFAYPPMKNWGYYLENKVWMMAQNQPGWVYDAATSTLYVSLPNGLNPNDVVVEVAEDKNILTLANSPDVTLQNLQIINSGLNAIQANGAANLSIFQIQVKNSYRLAFSFDGNTQPWKIQNSMVNNIGSDVIRQHYIARADAGILLENNDFQNIGTPLGPRFSAAAVLLNSYYPSPAVIRNNRFKNIAYVGIFGLAGAVIEGNVIENFCLLADDCGGIHISDRQPRVTVRNNILRNATANLSGKGRVAYAVAGLYLDDYSHGMTVTGNVVENVDIALMLHDAYDNVIQNNSFLNYKVYGVRSAEDSVRKRFDRPTAQFVPILNPSGQTVPASVNNLFVGNVLGSKYSAIPIWVYSNQGTGLDRIPAAIRGSGNTFLNPTTFTYLRFTSNAGSRDFTFEELAGLGVDRAPMKPFSSVTPGFQTVSESSTLNAGTASELSSFSVWSANVTATKAQVPCPIVSSSGICLLYSTAASEIGLAISKPFSTVRDTYYRARVQLRSATSKPALIGVSVRENVTPYGNIDALNQQLSVQARTEAGLWTTHDIYFRASATSANARIDFTIPVSSQVIFGGFDLKAVSVTATNFDQLLQVAVNPSTAQAVSIPCSLSGTLCSGWRDLEGFPTYFPFFVEPQSAVVLWRDPAASVTDLEPELGLVQRVELESATLMNVRDVGSNGNIRMAAFDLASGGAGLQALDPGDEFSIQVNLARAGAYHFALRVRTGYSNTSKSVPNSYLTTLNNYQVFIDGVAVQLIADLDGIAGPDSKGGGVFWGNLYTPNLSLSAGNHTVRIRMNSSWQMLDVLEVLTADVPFPSNTVLATVPTPDMNPPGANGSAQVIELETSSYTKVSDVGTNGTIRSAAFDLASGGAGLMMVDNGDEISIPVNVSSAGSYHFAVRVRTGYSSSATSGDPYSYLIARNNYQVFVDNKAVELSADLDSIEGPDSKGGGVYWGKLYSPNISLTSGPHTIRIRVNSNWQMLDLLEVLPSSTAIPEHLYLVTVP